MKIRIFNNSGIDRLTEITNAETGEKIPHIRGAEIHCSVDGLVTAELTFDIPEIDIFAIAELGEKTKKKLRELREILERIDREEPSNDR